MSHPRVVKKGTAAYDIYIGRGSPWGNPFHVGIHGSRNEVIEEYDRWIRGQPHLMARLQELKGKVLACFCAPKRCHGEVLIQLLKEQGIE